MLIGNLIYGLLNSAILAFMALGFSLTFGISGVANFAHGALYVFVGYATLVLYEQLSFPYILSVVVSTLFAGLFGGLMYRFIVLRVRGQITSEVIATFGVGLVILELVHYSTGGYAYNLPVLVDRSFEVAGVYIDGQRLIILAVCAILIFSLWLFTNYTRIGRAFRGIAQDERTALSLGINSDWMATLSISFGAMLAGLAAICIFPLGSLAIGEGYNVLLMALAVSIIGGLGRTGGVVLASLFIGFSEQFTNFYIGPNLKMVVGLAAMCLVLAIKPSGLLGQQKELEERI
ncbi:MAG: branched-chain amino acid ABC transporter permease [Deltaproteobacteria bacterium]|nr:MAG: branched-chain amino acid ABC transporter permease [Deltaproteobacteria bacterium]